MAYDDVLPVETIELARPVVAGYNGHPHSELALRWAADEAARLHVPLWVVYAANYPGMTVEPGLGLPSWSRERSTRPRR